MRRGQKALARRVKMDIIEGGRNILGGYSLFPRSKCREDDVCTASAAVRVDFLLPLARTLCARHPRNVEYKGLAHLGMVGILGRVCREIVDGRE